MMNKVRFGIIGCGLMGREFASAASRWCHLLDDIPQPEIIAVCDIKPENCNWFSRHIQTVRQVCSNYRELLQNKDIEAIYCAVPHLYHEEIYSAVIQAKKHLLGEKPFGIDQEANRRILQVIGQNPDVFVRCSSEFPFYPAAQVLVRWLQEERFGKMIEVKSGMYHSSDLDLNKPINWKRIVKYNGAYGSMGDLGLHTQHIVFRSSIYPDNVCAKLSNIVRNRPDQTGKPVMCDTYDNAILLCDGHNQKGDTFPLTFEMKRIAPGAANIFRIEIYGMERSAIFSTDDPNAFHYTDSWGKTQAWSRVVIGNQPIYPTVTAGIFEFGFSDAILQMWAAFMSELNHLHVPFSCVTPLETQSSHALQTAALRSWEQQAVVQINGQEKYQ